MEIDKKDWKLYLELLPKWQEKYMSQLMDKYLLLIKEDTYASKKFWKLDEEIKKDKNTYGVMVEVNKGEMINVIRWFINKKVIDKKELVGFSSSFIELLYI